MHVLVFGSRKYTDRDKVYAVLDRIHALKPITCVIHGTATGADEFGRDWARERNVVESGHAPDWDRYGNFAGNVRNQWMLDREHIDFAVSFGTGQGTRDMVGRIGISIPLKRFR